MTQKAIDAIDGEMLAPVVAPFGAVIPFDGEDQLANGLGQVAQPVVVLDGIVGRSREQLDHRAERTLLAQDRAAHAVVGLLVDRGKIPGQDSPTWSISL